MFAYQLIDQGRRQTMNSKLSHHTTSLKSRSYETEDDFRQMQYLLIEGRSRTDDWHYPHIGELQFNFFMVVCHLNPQEYIRLWHDDTGKLVGYAMLGEDPSFDWQALPEYEWSGIENEALAWAETKLAELRQEDSTRWGGNLGCLARQDNARRIAFLEGHGFGRGEYAEVSMLRSLDEPIPESILPAGYEVREIAERGEVAKRADLERAVWLPYTVGNISDDDYATFMHLPGYYRDLDVVTVAPDGVMVANVNGWIDSINRIGDFGPVGARKEYRQQGLTRAALLECTRRMQARGMNRVCVTTGEWNTAAIRLYESIGLKVESQYLNYSKPA
jgi:ribosomal protein S18 acetylase RimI-like enzyme